MLRNMAHHHEYLGLFKQVEICASNELPHRLHLSDCPSFFIVNTDPNFKPGSHWICIYVYSQNDIVHTYFYDPLGFSPSNYNKHIGRFLEYTTHFGGMCFMNDNVHQSETSELCGYYCLSFFFSLFTLSTEPHAIASVMVNMSEEDIVKKTLVCCKLI